MERRVAYEVNAEPQGCTWLFVLEGAFQDGVVTWKARGETQGVVGSTSGMLTEGFIGEMLHRVI